MTRDEVALPFVRGCDLTLVKIAKLAPALMLKQIVFKIIHHTFIEFEALVRFISLNLQANRGPVVHYLFICLSRSFGRAPLILNLKLFSLCD